MNTPHPVVPVQQRQLLNDFDLRTMWRVIKHRKWRIITLTIIVSMLATLVALSKTPIYRASTTLLIDPQKSHIVGIEPINLFTQHKEYLATQFALLKSRELIQRVVRENDLSEHWEFRPKNKEKPLVDWVKEFDLAHILPIALPEAPPPVTPNREALIRAAADSLMARTSIAPIGGTQLVKVHVEMADPELAANIANALAQGYIESQLEARVEMTETSKNWMSNRLVDLKNSLQSSERRLQEYLENENLVDLDGDITTLSADSLSGIGAQLTRARKDLASAESQYRQVKSIDRNDIRRLSSLPAVLANPLVQQFKSEKARAESRVQELAQYYGPKYPKMIKAQSELRSATESLRKQVEQVVASIERNYQLARANEHSLNSIYQENKGEIQDISRKEFKLRELQLDVDTNRSLYNVFLNRLKETSATSGLNTANARIVEPAVVPTVPFKPHKSMIVAMSALLALIVSVGMALLVNMLDNTFKTSTQVEERLNLPVLGSIPLVEKRHIKALSRLFLEKDEKRFSEAIRSIRTSVMLSTSNQPKHLLVVTSSTPGEGKSTLASNLALSLGQMKSTLLIDADMRRPTVAKNFDLKPGTPGLANLVAGNAEARECLQKKEGIYVLSAGSVPPNPLELISSPRFGEVLEALRKQFDYVVVDSPPLQAVSDPLMIASHADMLVYVIKADDTPIEQVEAGIGQLLQKKMRISGTVLSQIDINKAKHYSYRDGANYDEYLT